MIRKFEWNKPWEGEHLGKKIPRGGGRNRCGKNRDGKDMVRKRTRGENAEVEKTGVEKT